MNTTDGTLLNGRVSYRQPVEGYRTGIEPVLLAAAVPARAGDTVLEAGLGAGAGLLCLAARVPGVRGTGVEIDPGMAALARLNLDGNGLQDWPVLTSDVLSSGKPALWTPGTFCHAMANPPWHDPAATPSPDSGRALAKQEQPGGLHAWAAALTAAVRPGGSVTLILPGLRAAAGLHVLQAVGCGGLTLFPLWPKAGRDARIVLIQGHRGSIGPGRIAAGLVLHEDGGRYTLLAETILRDGSALVLQRLPA